MKVTAISADTRLLSKETSAAAIRRQSRVPGVLYGLDKNILFSVDARELRKLVYTSEFSLIDLEVEGTTYRCILKDYQMHPVTDAMVHVDMLALKDGRAVKVEIPVHFVGSSPGQKAGGSIVRKLRKVLVKTTPEKLMSEFEVDISHLNLGESVRVRDMDVADGVQVMNQGPMPLATIEVPRALKAAEAEEAAAAEEEAGAEVVPEAGDETES